MAAVALVFAAPPPLGFPADGARCEGCLLAPELGCLVGDLGLAPVAPGDRPVPAGLVVAAGLPGDLVGVPCFEVAVAPAVPLLAAVFEGVVDCFGCGEVGLALLAPGLPPVSAGLLLTGEVGRPDLCLGGPVCFGLDDVGPPSVSSVLAALDGLAAPDGLVVPDGLVAPAGLVAPEGLAAPADLDELVGLPVGLAVPEALVAPAPVGLAVPVGFLAPVDLAPADLAAVVGLAGLSAPPSLLGGAFLAVVGFAVSLGFGEVGLPCGEVGLLFGEVDWPFGDVGRPRGEVGLPPSVLVAL